MDTGNPFKKMLDSRAAWDLFQGAVYNRLIWNAAGDVIEEMIDRTPPPRADAHALDVGSGPGYATRLVAEKHPAATVTGVDYSPAQVRWARRQLRRRPVPNCSFRVGDAMALPCEDATFDFVFSIASIKHWPDPARGLAEILRVLRPGGAALVGEADRDADPAHLRAFIRRFTAPWWVNKPATRWYLKYVVFGQSMTRAQAAGAARAAGFGHVPAEPVPGRPFWMLDLKKPAGGTA